MKFLSLLFLIAVTDWSVGQAPMVQAVAYSRSTTPGIPPGPGGLDSHTAPGVPGRLPALPRDAQPPVPPRRLRARIAAETVERIALRFPPTDQSGWG